MKNTNTKSLHEVLSKFRDWQGNYSLILPADTLFACFIFLGLLIHKFRTNLPSSLREALDWEQIPGLKNPGDHGIDTKSYTLRIFQGHLRSIPPALERLSESNDGFFSDNLRQAISVTGKLIKKCERVSLEALSGLAEWVKDQPLETSTQQRNLLKEFDKLFYLVSAGSSRGNTGEYTTPKSISRLMAALTEPLVGRDETHHVFPSSTPSPNNFPSGNKVYDPCFGSGHLLTESISRYSAGRQIPFGTEIRPESFIIGFTRLLLSGVDDPQLKLGNALHPDPTQNESFDVVLANPPWGGRYKESKNIFPIPTADTAGLFLQHALSKLRPGGLAALVLPEGFLFRISDRALRKALVLDHNVKAIISLPSDSIYYSSIKPNILMVSKGGSTQKIRMVKAESFFEVNKQNNLFHLPKTRLSHLLDNVYLDATSDASWDMGINEIKGREWDLTPKRPNLMLPRALKLLKKCDFYSLKDCCDVLNGRHIKSSDLVDKAHTGFHFTKKINSLDLPDSTNVLSVSAAETNHLIEKYLVHSCPNTYSYKDTRFITFRLPPHGAMNTIYEIDKILQITKNEKSNLINEKDFSQGLDQKEIERLRNYLKGNPFPKNDRFYLLSRWKKLPHEFTPAEYKNIPMYPTIGQLLTGEIPELSEDEINSARGAILYIRIKDIQQNKFTSSSTYLSPNASSSIKEQWKLNAGDVLLSKSATIGKTVLITAAFTFKNNVVDALASSGLFVLRANKKLINPYYLHAYLKSMVVKEWLEDHARGTTIQHLSKSVLEKLTIPLPDLDIQDQITEDKKDFWQALEDKLSLGEDSSVCGKIVDWSFKAKIKVEHNKDPLQFEYLEKLATDVRTVRNQVIHERNKEDYKRSEHDEELTTWILALSDLLEGMVGISNIPHGPGLLSVLLDALSTLDSMEFNLQDETLDAAWFDGGWEGTPENVERAVDFNWSLSTELRSAVSILSEDVKLTFTAKTSQLPKNKTVECEIVIRNQGILPLKNLTVCGDLKINKTEHGFTPNDLTKSNPDWGRMNCPYLPENGEHRFILKGKTPNLLCDIELLLSWDAFSLNGDKEEGSQQIPFKIIETETARSPEISDLGGSPYIAGDPVGPNHKDVFFGRETLLDSIRRQVIENGNVVLLEGNRRAGKTSILRHLEGATSIPGWFSVYCSLQSAKGSPDGVGVPTEEVFREMAYCIAKGPLSIGLECPLPNNTTQSPGKRLGIAKACREGISKENPFADFRDYLEIILEILQQKNLGLLLMTDEFDKLQEGIDNGVTSPQTPENIRSLIHQYPRFSTILTGSRRLKRLREEYWSALFGLGTRENVSALESDAAVQLITEPVKGQLTFSKGAVDQVCVLTARQPYLTQCLCNRIFDLAARENTRSITLDLVDRAADILVENNEHFASLWDYARSDRRRFLLALLWKESKNLDALRLGVIQEKLLSKGIEVGDDALIEDLEHLQELELVKLIDKTDDGQYQLEVPLMGNWIQRQTDFEALLSKARNETEDQG